ncbi:MAG TPA: hypothetical protein VKJ65_12195, partial [Phycisphaerae bacterium]|nr:hypothetical protein [Phycisphaerae bacterium]
MGSIASEKDTVIMPSAGHLTGEHTQDVTHSIVVDWLDRYFPWLASILIHLAVLIIVVFAIQVISSVVNQKPDIIVIPQGFNQPF